MNYTTEGQVTRTCVQNEREADEVDIRISDFSNSTPMFSYMSIPNINGYREIMCFCLELTKNTLVHQNIKIIFMIVITIGS